MTKGTPPYWHDLPPCPWKKRTWSEEMQQAWMCVRRFLVNLWLGWRLRMWIGSFSSALLQPAPVPIVFEGRRSVAAGTIWPQHSHKPGHAPWRLLRTPWNSQHHCAGAPATPASSIIEQKVLCPYLYAAVWKETIEINPSRWSLDLNIQKYPCEIKIMGLLGKNVLVDIWWSFT